MISKLLAWWWLYWNPQCNVPGCEEFLTWEGVCRKHYDEARKLKRSEMLATLPRSSQNQTVSSGVEGAHEGITADKSGEPEKLNNAQKMGTCTCYNDGNVSECDIHGAESSLSSPPPKPGTAEYYARQTGEVLASGSYSNGAFEIALEIRRDSTFRQSPSLTGHGPESADSGKQNTADKSELLPPQLPKEK